LKLYDLSKIPWQETQLIYHALAQLGQDALCLVSPATPYVCIGFHQDVEQEVDMDYCRSHSIPVFRREVGGGAVFLDGNQLFFQLVIKRNNPIVPKKIDAFYKKFLQPVITVHRRIGIEAEYKPVNDLVVENRKISGSGAAEIGECIVFVGNLILDFDYETMARVLKIPDEKFRDKVRKTIEENLSTIDRELSKTASAQPDEQALNNMVAEEFAKTVGRLTPAAQDDRLINKMKMLEASMMDKAWLYRKGKRAVERSVKIRAGLEVKHRLHKATGGLIRADYALEDGKMKDVYISGDFFCFPADAVDRLAARLEGCTPDDIADVVADFYQPADTEIPGVTVDDWLQVFNPK
jgi:lipoate-protein ligase A